METQRLVLAVLGAKPLNAEAVCFRAGLVVNRPNMKAVRAVLAELCRADRAKSRLAFAVQEVLYTAV